MIDSKIHKPNRHRRKDKNMNYADIDFEWERTTCDNCGCEFDRVETEHECPECGYSYWDD